MHSHLDEAAIKKADVIAIIGRPEAGKTTLADKLGAMKGCRVIHTDDFIKKMTFKDAAGEIIKLCNEEKSPYIVEGVQVARMLLTGQKEQTWKPDLVIYVNAATAPDPKHKGLATLTQKAYQDWMAEDHGVPVMRYLRQPNR